MVWFSNGRALAKAIAIVPTIRKPGQSQVDGDGDGNGDGHSQSHSQYHGHVDARGSINDLGVVYTTIQLSLLLLGGGEGG